MSEQAETALPQAVQELIEELIDRDLDGVTTFASALRAVAVRALEGRAQAPAAAEIEHERLAPDAASAQRRRLMAEASENAARLGGKMMPKPYTHESGCGRCVSFAVDHNGGVFGWLKVIALFARHRWRGCNRRPLTAPPSTGAKK